MDAVNLMFTLPTRTPPPRLTPTPPPTLTPTTILTSTLTLTLALPLTSTQRRVLERWHQHPLPGGVQVAGLRRLLPPPSSSRGGPAVLLGGHHQALQDALHGHERRCAVLKGGAQPRQACGHRHVAHRAHTPRLRHHRLGTYARDSLIPSGKRNLHRHFLMSRY